MKAYYNGDYEKTLAFMHPLSPKFKSQFHVKNVEAECNLNIISNFIVRGENEYALERISKLPSDIYKKDKFEQLERDAKSRIAEATKRREQMNTAKATERQGQMNRNEYSANRVQTVDTRKRIFWDLVSEEDKVGIAGDYEQCKKNIAQRYGISVADVRKIQAEAIEKGWPMPKDPYLNKNVSQSRPQTQYSTTSGNSLARRCEVCRGSNRLRTLAGCTVCVECEKEVLGLYDYLRRNGLAR